MKVFSCITESHKSLAPYFLGSFPFEDGMNLEVRCIPQDCKTGEYFEDGWADSMKRRMINILDALQALNYNNLFLHCDIDIEFFGPIRHDLTNLLGDKDFAIQKDHPSGQACNGFFVCRKTDKVLELISRTIAMTGTRFNCDQPSLNAALAEMNYGHILLPERYYTIGQTGNGWDGVGNPNLNLPKDVLMYHANWTKGIENKIKLLEAAKSIVIGRGDCLTL